MELWTLAVDKQHSMKYLPCLFEASVAQSDLQVRPHCAAGSIMPVISSSLPEERIIFPSMAIDSDIRNAGDLDQRVDAQLQRGLISR